MPPRGTGHMSTGSRSLYDATTPMRGSLCVPTSAEAVSLLPIHPSIEVVPTHFFAVLPMSLAFAPDQARLGNDTVTQEIPVVAILIDIKIQ